MPQIESLQAEFQLITKSFRTEIANVIKDIEKVGAALNALGAGNTGLEKAVAGLERTEQATKQTRNSAKSLIDVLLEQVQALEKARLAGSSLAQAQTDALGATRALQATEEAEKELLRRLTQLHFEAIQGIKSQGSAEEILQRQIRETTRAQEQQIATILRGHQVKELPPTGGFGEFAVAGAAALVQQRKELAAANEVTAKTERDLAQAAEALSAALTAETNRFAETSAALRRNIAIYEQAIAAGTTYAQAQRQIAAAEAGARFGTLAHATAIEQLTQQELELQAQLRSRGAALRETAQGFQEVDNKSRSALETVGHFLGRIALFSVGAGLVVRGFFEIIQAIKDTVAGGIAFNQQMEESVVVMAALIGTSRNLADAQGQTLTFAQAYPALLAKAEDIQQQIILANATTLGTGEELLGVYKQILGLSGAQKGNLEDVLEISQLVTNIGKIQGLTGEQLVEEARQLFTLESARGQLVLRTLNISIQDARAAEKRGELFELLRSKGAAFLGITEELANSWTGITSTASTFVSLLEGAAFENVFNLAKQFLKGFNDELEKIIKAGGLAGALTVDPQQIEEAGRVFAQVFAGFTQAIAAATEQLAAFTASFSSFGLDIAQSEIYQLGATLLANVLPGVENFVALVQKALLALIGTFNSMISAASGFAVAIVAPFTAASAAIGSIADDLVNKRIPSISKALNAFGESYQQSLDFFVSQQEKAGEEFAKAWTLPDNFGKEIAQNFAAQDAHVKAYRKNLADLLEIQQKRTAQSEAATKAEKQLADALDKLAGAQLRLQEQLAQVSFDPAVLDTLLQARLAKIDAALNEERKKVQENKQAVAILEKAAAVDRLTAIGENVQKQLALLDRITQFYQREADLALERDRVRKESAQSLLEVEGEALQQQLDLAKERAGTYTEQIALIERIGKLQVQIAQNEVANIEREIQAREVLISKLQSQQATAVVALGDKAGTLEFANALAEVLKLMQDIGKEQNALADSTGQLAVAQAKVGIATTKAGEDIRKATTVTKSFGSAITRSITDIFDALIAGTLSFNKIFQSFALGIGRIFVEGFAEAISAKLGFDAIFKKNVGGLSGILGTFASGIGSTFSGIFKLLGGDLKELTPALSNLFGSIKAFDIKNIFGDLGQVFKSFGPILQGIGGSFAGDFFTKIFKLDKSTEAKIGGQVGSTVGTILAQVFEKALTVVLGPVLGPLAPFLGSFIGKILGSLLGGLFAHIPTKGTQIRKGVVKWLKDLDVQFSDELKAGTYGFEWIKDYAKANNISFLEASKHFIPENFPDLVKGNLDKQLLALGLAITAESAKKLGKDLKQTGITFANLIVDNLGGDPEKIKTFIDDLVQKGQFTLENVIGSLNESMRAGRIDAELYNKAVEGTVRLFVTDLPKAIDIKKLIAGATVEGILDVDKLKANIDAIKAEFEELKGLIANTLQEGVNAAAAGKPLSLEQFAKSFGDQLKTILRNSIIEAVTEGIAGLLTTGALGSLFAELSKLAADFGQGKITKEEFGAKLKEQIDKAKPAIKELIDAFGPLGEFVIKLLEDLGLLPEAIEEASTAFDFSNIGQGLLESIRGSIAGGHLFPQDVLDNLRIDIGLAIMEGINTGIINATIKPWIDTIGKNFQTDIEKAMKDGVIDAKELEEILRRGALGFRRLPQEVEAGIKLLDAFINSPEYKKLQNLFNARETARSFQTALKSIGQGLTEEIKKQLKETGEVDFSALKTSLKAQISEAIITAILDSIIQIAIIEPIITGLFAGFGTQLKTALEDGKIDAIELAAILATGSAAMRGIPDAIGAGVALLKGLFDDPNFQELLKNIRTPGAPTGGGGGGGGGGAPSTVFGEGGKSVEANLEAIKNALETLRDLFRDVGEDLVNILADIDEQLADAISKLQESIKDPFEKLRQGLGRYHVVIKDITDLLDIPKLLKGLSPIDARLAKVQIELFKAELKKLGFSFEEILIIIKDAQKRAEEEKKKALKEFLDPFREFIKEAGGDSDALADLFNKFQELEARLLKNAEELIKNGVDVSKLWEEMFEAFKRQLAKLKEELLDPIADAIDDIKPGKIKPLNDFLDQIGKAKGLDELSKIRDLAIDAIRRTLDAQIEAARKISEERIAKLREEHDVAINQANERKTGLVRLFQLRQQQLNEEVQRIKTMRDTAATLKQTAKDLNLSNVSPLKPLQRLSEAQRNFNADVVKARAGDIEAAKRLPQLAQQLLAEARIVFASSPQFTAIFEMVQTALRSVGAELNHEAKVAENQLKKLNDIETVEQEIARLTKELGLTGNESLQDLLDEQKNVDEYIDLLNKNLEAAIKAEQKALEDKIIKFQDNAIKQLKILEEALAKKFDQLIAALIYETLPPPNLPPPPPSPSPPIEGGPSPQLALLLAQAQRVSLDALTNAFSQALDERQPQSISIPIQVVTADGKVIADTVLTRLTTETANGKIIINALGSGSTGLF